MVWAESVESALRPSRHIYYTTNEHKSQYTKCTNFYHFARTPLCKMTAPGPAPAGFCPVFISPIWGVADYSATSSVAVSSVSATARA